MSTQKFKIATYHQPQIDEESKYCEPEYYVSKPIKIDVNKFENPKENLDEVMKQIKEILTSN
jgi:hypothetical protein